MYIVKPPRIVNLLTKNNLVWKITTEEKRIFLTFDDGPIEELTPWVLDVLQEYKAKATFFCVGDNVQKNPTIFKRIVKEKHTVGNHTFNHLNGWKNKLDDYVKNIEEFQKYLERDLFRPPYGKIKPKQIKKLKEDYSIIYWTVLSGDFDENLKPEKCLQRITKKTKAGSIIVFHDNMKAYPRIKYALPRYLEHFSELGYSFDALTKKDVDAT
jgi:peptidoglycan/xylan/chitin deacetylase (PgdA/CDA1 family)